MYLASQSKTQNFFEMNPVYPDMAEKGFDLYNSERKKIHVLDEYVRLEKQKTDIRTLVRRKIYLKKYEKFKKYTGGRITRMDK